MDVEKLSKRKQTSAPAATEKAPIEPERASAEVPSAPVVPEAAAPIQIPPKVLAQAKALGVDLKQIVDWAQNVETRLQAADQNFLKIGSFLERMEPLVKLGEQIQQRQTQPQAPAGPPAAGGFDIASLLQMAPALLGGGSSGIGDEITKKIIDAGLDQMFAGTELLKAMQRKLMTEMGVKTVMEAVAK